MHRVFASKRNLVLDELLPTKSDTQHNLRK